MSGLLETIIIYSFILSLFGAVSSGLARRKNKSEIWGFMLGLFFGIWAWIYYLIIKGGIPCKYCQEKISSKAIICPHCRKKLKIIKK